MKFYRIANDETKQGLWYNQQGEFTGLIHNEFSFCTNSKLPMDFDEEIVGWLSAAHDMETLDLWFTKEDIKQLQGHGYFIYVYECDDYKYYEKFQHYVINQKTAKLLERIEI